VFDPENVFIVPDSANDGNGERLYNIVNEYDISRSIVRFEIEAGLDLNSFGNSTIGSFATLNPTLYAYEAIRISENNFSPKFTYNASSEDFSEDSLNTLLGLPGVSFDSETGLVSIPEYKLEDFKLTYISDPLFELQWTDWFDGIQFRFDNGPNNFDGNPLALVDIKNITYSDTTLRKLIDIKMRYKFESDLARRPMFNYKISFSDTLLSYAYQTTPSSGCNDTFEGNTPLPFIITNMTTGRPIKVLHLDKGMETGGVEYGELSVGGGCVPVCQDAISGTTCIEGECVPLTGYKNCVWEPNEILLFIDTVYTSNDLDGVEEKIYNFKLNFDGRRYFIENSGIPLNEMNEYSYFHIYWVEGGLYDSLDVVTYKAMLYQATKEITASYVPDGWYGDNSVNDNPWQMLYPWAEGDSIIIEPYGWYKDGDAWVVDMSKIGSPDDDSSDNLDNIKVVPTPFIGNSNYFNESPGNSLMRFNHLPQKCTISIYTISGEFVTSIDHDDNFDGSEWWDVKNGRGQEIAPGLYIYVVETPTGEKKIDKFAVVR
jgi:hypothetical protein